MDFKTAKRIVALAAFPELNRKFSVQAAVLFHKECPELSLVDVRDFVKSVPTKGYFNSLMELVDRCVPDKEQVIAACKNEIRRMEHLIEHMENIQRDRGYN